MVIPLTHVVCRFFGTIPFKERVLCIRLWFWIKTLIRVIYGVLLSSSHCVLVVGHLFSICIVFSSQCAHVLSVSRV